MGYIPRWDTLPRGHVMKTIYRAKYKVLVRWLAQHRLASGMTQEDLAHRLGKPQSYVSKLETGERRIDIIEFLDITKAIDADPIPLLRQLMRPDSK